MGCAYGAWLSISRLRYFSGCHNKVQVIIYLCLCWSLNKGSKLTRKHNNDVIMPIALGRGPAYVKIHHKVVYPIAAVEEYEQEHLHQPLAV